MLKIFHLEVFGSLFLVQISLVLSPFTLLLCFLILASLNLLLEQLSLQRDVCVRMYPHEMQNSHYDLQHHWKLKRDEERIGQMGKSKN